MRALKKYLYIAILFFIILRQYKPLVLNLSLIEYVRSAHFDNVATMLAPSNFHQADLCSLERSLVTSASYYPQNDVTWLALGFVKFYQGDEKGALARWENITNRDLLFNIGLFFESLDNYITASNIYERAPSLSKGNIGLSIFYFRIGFINHELISPSDLSSAILYYSKAEQSGDFYPYSWYQVEVYNYLGNIYMQHEEYDRAIGNYEQSLKIKPLQYWTLVNYARALWKINDIEQAKQILFKAIEIDPMQTDAYLVLGRISQERNSVSDAITAYKNVLEYDPENEEALDALKELLNINRAP